jgi:hypothetical protein
MRRVSRLSFSRDLSRPPSNLLPRSDLSPRLERSLSRFGELPLVSESIISCKLSSQHNLISNSRIYAKKVQIIFKINNLQHLLDVFFADTFIRKKFQNNAEKRKLEKWHKFNFPSLTNNITRCIDTLNTFLLCF